MNLNDLKQIMEERSANTAEHVVYDARLLSVRTRLVAKRRLRVATWTACLVAALVGLTAAVVVGRQPHTIVSPVGPSPMRTIAGFPEYADGARVVAAQSARLPTQRIELTLTPSTRDLVMFVRCDTNEIVPRLDFTLAVNGRDFPVHFSCPSASRMAFTERDLAIGKPATFVLGVKGKEYSTAGLVDGPLPASGEFAFAIGERVPFADYPLPPRPVRPLTPLDFALPLGCTVAQCPGGLVIRSDPDDPAKPIQKASTWHTNWPTTVVAQTPGLLHLKINGVEVFTGEWWEYEGVSYLLADPTGAEWTRGLGLDLQAGDLVTVEVIPEYFTGEWLVVFYPPE